MKMPRKYKLISCGFTVCFIWAACVGTWKFYNGDEISGADFRQLSNEWSHTSMGSTSYMGGAHGFDYFRIKQAMEAKNVRVPIGESPVRDPYPLRYVPGNWKTGSFRDWSPDAEWFFYDRQ
jgi:hypothetical protein